MTIAPTPPIFLLSPARSGSSVVVSMLGQHPRLYGFPELRLFRGTHVRELLVDPPPGAGMPARERASGLLRALAELHEGEQSDDATSRAWQWLQDRGGWPVRAVLDHLLEVVAPRTGIEKSPETSLSDAALARAAQAYPQARYIHLARHPWSTVASMVAAWSPLPYWTVPRDHAHAYCAALWLEQHRRIGRFGTTIGPSRFIRARAEDVTGTDAAGLIRLCRWLDISAGPACVAAMRSPQDSRYARPGPEGASGGFDPAFLHRPALRALSVPPGRPPASWHIPPGLQRAVAAMARDLGYACTEPDPGWLAGRRSLAGRRPPRAPRRA